MEIHTVIYFLDGLEGEEYISIQGEGGELAIQKVKNSFVCNLWGWVKLYNGAEPHSLIGFLEWIASS